MPARLGTPSQVPFLGGSIIGAESFSDPRRRSPPGARTFAGEGAFGFEGDSGHSYTVAARTMQTSR
jgi:hypothetical protein